MVAFDDGGDGVVVDDVEVDDGTDTDVLQLHHLLLQKFQQTPARCRREDDIGGDFLH